MSIKLEIKSSKYIRTETTEEGFLVSKKEYEMRYLPQVMEHLSSSAAPDENEHLLMLLRKSYKLFNARSFEFVKKPD